MAPTDDGEANDPLVGVSPPSLLPPRPTGGSPYQGVTYSFSFTLFHQITWQGFDYYGVSALYKNLLSATCQRAASVEAGKRTINISSKNSPPRKFSEMFVAFGPGSLQYLLYAFFAVSSHVLPHVTRLDESFLADLSSISQKVIGC